MGFMDSTVKLLVVTGLVAPDPSMKFVWLSIAHTIAVYISVVVKSPMCFVLLGMF